MQFRFFIKQKVIRRFVFQNRIENYVHNENCMIGIIRLEIWEVLA